MQPIPIPVSLALSASSSIAGDDDDYSDDEAAFFNQPVPRSQLYAPPQPSTTSPPDSIGKGKGKAKDDAAETDEPGTNTAQESEARSKAERDEKELSDAGERNAALRKQLEALEAVDDHTIKRLIDLDPTPIRKLSSTTKLLRAMDLLQRAFVMDNDIFQEQRPDDPYPGVGATYGTTTTHSFVLPMASIFGGGAFGGNNTQWSRMMGNAEPGAPTPPVVNPLKVETYATIMELLSSTLNDISMPSPPLPDLPSQRQAEYNLHLSRLRLGLSVSGQGASFVPPSASISKPAPPPPIPNQVEDTQSDIDISALISENMRLLLLKLKPAPLTPNPLSLDSQGSSSSTNNNSKEGTTASREGYRGYPYISKLPAEILGIIFSLARKASEERIEPAVPPGMSVRIGPGGRMDLGPGGRGRVPGEKMLLGSRTNAQGWCHSLALVCRDWRDTSRSIAYQNLHLRRSVQLPKLLSLLNSGTNSFSNHITEINIKIPTPPIDPTLVGSLRGTRGGNWRVHQMVGYSAGWNNGAIGGSGVAGEKAEENHGSMFGQLVALAKNLQNLSLTVLGSHYSQGFSGRSSGGSEFLEPQMLHTLSHIELLRSLTLGTCVDFEELEVILLGLPLLEHLTLEAGFDDINGSGLVTSTEPHRCRLKTFIVGTGYPTRDYTQVTETQLGWLVEPAADSLIQLELSILAINPAFPVFGGVGGQVATPPCFASGILADSLGRMTKLQRLLLKDSQNGGTMMPSFQQAPHNSTFDYALSHLTELREVTIQFIYTSTTLLSSLGNCPSLEALYLLGHPSTSTASAADLANAIEDGDFMKNLRKLVISGQFPGGASRGAGGFRGNDVRRLKEVCKSKGVVCIFHQG